MTKVMRHVACMMYLQECSPAYEGVGYRAVMPRIRGIDEVVPLQPDVAFGNLGSTSTLYVRQL